MPRFTMTLQCPECGAAITYENERPDWQVDQDESERQTAAEAFIAEQIIGTAPADWPPVSEWPERITRPPWLTTDPLAAIAYGVMYPPAYRAAWRPSVERLETLYVDCLACAARVTRADRLLTVSTTETTTTEETTTTTEEDRPAPFVAGHGDLRMAAADPLADDEPITVPGASGRPVTFAPGQPGYRIAQLYNTSPTVRAAIRELIAGDSPTAATPADRVGGSHVYAELYERQDSTDRVQIECWAVRCERKAIAIKLGRQIDRRGWVIVDARCIEHWAEDETPADDDLPVDTTPGGPPHPGSRDGQPEPHRSKWGRPAPAYTQRAAE